MNELMHIFRSTTVAMWMSWHRLTHGLKPDHKSVALETVSVVDGGPEMQEPELKTYSEVIQFLDFQTARYTNSVVCRAETLARLDNILEVFDGQIETDPKRGLAIIRHTSVSEKHELIWKILELLNLAIFENPLSLYQENEGVATSCTLSLLSLRRSVFMLFEGILDDENVRRSEIFIEMVYDEYVARRMYDTILDRRIRRAYGLPAIMAAEYLVNLLASDV